MKAAVFRKLRAPLEVESLPDPTPAADVLDHDGDAPRAVVTDVIGLDALPAAFEALRQRTSQCKVLVDPFG